MNTKIQFLFVLAVLLLLCNCDSKKTLLPDSNSSTTKLKVLALNTWQEGSSVTGGFEAISDVILETEADIVMFAEIRNYNNTNFSERVLKSLNEKGAIFYAINSKKSPLVISKFPLLLTTDLNSDSLSRIEVKLDENTNISVYAAHLDYTHYACYLPRGYDGITWQKLPAPVLNVDEVLEQNINSTRDEAIKIFLEDAKKEQEKGNIIFLGGDFNEPSHLDWANNTKDLFDHNGLVVPWQNSLTLKNNNFLDSYRTKHPDAVKYPGITWPANNKEVKLSSLVWTPEADDRDRVDFIYYKEHKKLELVESVVVGPVGSIVNGKRVETNPGDDTIFVPKGVWPSDHKGVLSTFLIKK